MPKYLDQDGVAYLWQKIHNNLNNKLKYYARRKEEWDSDISIISEKNVLYIYTDYKTIEKDGQQILLPGLKIGDGKAFLIDLPFVGGSNNDILEKQILDHINDNIIHVNLEEKNFWNNKLNYELSEDENLIFNRN